jgi:hypothetical protein
MPKWYGLQGLIIIIIIAGDAVHWFLVTFVDICGSYTPATIVASTNWTVHHSAFTQIKHDDVAKLSGEQHTITASEPFRTIHRTVITVKCNPTVAWRTTTATRTAATR